MDRLRRTVLFLAALAIVTTSIMFGQFEHFIAASGGKLMDGNREYRFISLNTPNLHYVEDYLPFEGTNPWRLPNEFEIRDALTAIKQLGGKVTRIYVLSVRRQDDAPGTIRHVEAPGTFNAEAFRALDKVLQLANEVGVRVIIPFVDNWKWWGGPVEYAAFRGKQKDEFWTDPQLIADFKQTIEFLVNRTNEFTGVKYSDDKAVFAWETGNEIVAPFSWTKQIAAYIKSLDTNHLVMEGTLAKELTQEALADTNIDIVSSHHYGDPGVSLRFIVANQKLAKGKKPYVVGEYGIVPTQDLRAITDTIIHQGIAGGMVWSLRFRCREGGFYNHYEYNNVASYRWPGFANGDFYDERMVLSIIREKAYEIDGLVQPRVPVPEKPTLLPIDDVSSISWQGSTGARSYVVERKDQDSTAWRVIAQDVDESKYQFRPLVSDETARFGGRYSYRVAARNESGLSDYSNVVGPVEVTSLKLVDEMDSFGRVYQKDGDLSLLTSQDIRKAKEDRSRLVGKNGSSIVYKVPSSVTSLSIDAYRTAEEGTISVAADSTPNASVNLTLKLAIHRFGKNDYGFFDAVTYRCDQLPAGTRFVRIMLSEGIQIARVEISCSISSVP